MDVQVWGSNKHRMYKRDLCSHEDQLLGLDRAANSRQQQKHYGPKSKRTFYLAILEICIKLGIFVKFSITAFSQYCLKPYFFEPNLNAISETNPPLIRNMPKTAALSLDSGVLDKDQAVAEILV